MVGSDTRLYPASRLAASGRHATRRRADTTNFVRGLRILSNDAVTVGEDAWVPRAETERSVEFLRSVAKHGAVAFLVSHGFSSTVAKDAEPAALARTAYHVLVAWIAVTAAHVGASARSLTGSSLIRSLSTSLRRAFSSSPHRPRP
jgi:hypothetical protein